MPVSERGEVQATLKQFLVKDLLQGDDPGIQGKSPLLDWGIIDSLNMMKLVRFAEKSFGCQLPLKVLGPKVFATLDAFTDLVLAQQSLAP